MSRFAKHVQGIQEAAARARALDKDRHFERAGEPSRDASRRGYPVARIDAFRSRLFDMPDSPPRYEFRIWDDNLEALKRRLEELGIHERSVDGTELYLVSRTTDKCNAKIRAGLLDVKQLVGETRGLQQWRPILKAPFPLESPAIMACLACLTAESGSLARSAYTAGEFLGEVVARSQILVPVAISKRREIFSLDGCRAEFARVTTPTRPDAIARDTVAIESLDAERLIDLASRLDIRRYPNRSYVQEIRRLMQL